VQTEPTTTLYFVRHGETDFNRQRIVQGRKINSSLNATGIRQAEALAERFRDVPLDAIYTSELERARQTARIVADGHPAIRIRSLADLEEMSWGVYEGLGSSVELDSFLTDLYARWGRGEFDYRVEGGESILELQERALRAVRTIVDEQAGRSVLVVTHGRFLRVLLASVLEEYGLERMNDIDHANTAVNHVLCIDGRYEARLLNCTDHLSRPDLAPVG
jgi:phosphoserine phosphatase